MSNVVEQKTVTLDGANGALEAALKKAETLGLKACVAVVDRAGQLKAYVRMDGAPAVAAEVAKDKAYTVIATGMPTHLMSAGMQQAPAAAVITLLKYDGMQILGGGIPLVSQGETVGAIGVSGGTAEQDQEAAEAGAAVLA